jgi:hypothetical protein
VRRPLVLDTGALAATTEDVEDLARSPNIDVVRV